MDLVEHSYQNQASYGRERDPGCVSKCGRDYIFNGYWIIAYLN